MIISASILQYNTFDIKRALDTKISELSDDGVYDFLPYPTIDVQSPYTSGPFWKGDTILIKWNYNEPLNNLIPSSSIYLMSGSNQTLLFENIPTENKNINWTIPKWVKEKTTYFVKVESKFDGEVIADVSPTFTFDTRTIEITSKPPVPFIIANQGETYTLTWNGKGTSDYFRIELIESVNSPEINFEERVGRIIRNPDSQQQGEVLETNEPPVVDIQSSNIIKVLEDKYYTTNGTYEWTVNEIENYSLNFVRIRITDVMNLTTAVSPEIGLLVPHISVGQVGRGIQLDLTGPSVITGSGEGNADISAYAFDPSTFIVSMSNDFSFQYTSTNAIRVYLKKQSDPYYFEEISLSGGHVITNITQDETYTLNAEDSNQKLKTIVLNIKLKVEEPIINNDITTFTKQQLLMYASTLMLEVQTSGDAVIDPNSPVNGKIAFYINEASQTDENSDEQAVWYLLKNLNEEVLVAFISGPPDYPGIILFDGTDLKNRVISLNQEIGRRYNTIINTPHKVSGYVFDSNNTPMSGVEMRFSDINITVPTDINGYYEANVPYGYIGSLTPYLSGYIFNPSNINYINTPVISDLNNLDFIAVVSPVIPKNFGMKVSGISEANSGIEIGSILDKDNSINVIIDRSVVLFETNMSKNKANEIYIYLTYEGWNNLLEIKPRINGQLTNYIETTDNTVYTNGKKYTVSIPYSNSEVYLVIQFDLIS